MLFGLDGGKNVGVLLLENVQWRGEETSGGAKPDCSAACRVRQLGEAL
jgi:hypothetical protein